MASTRTVVVAGYGAWARTSPNPAALTIAQLATQSWPSCRLVALEIPVRTHALQSLVEDALLAHRPDVWLGIGVAPGAALIRVEAVGINCRDFDVADNDEIVLQGAPVIDSGVAAHFATLPARRIVESMREQGVPAELSYSAGTHLCNQMLYTSLHLIEQHELETRCGFMHVPFTPEFVAAHQVEDGVQPSLPLSVMTQAASICIDVTLESLANDDPSARTAAQPNQETA